MTLVIGRKNSAAAQDAADLRRASRVAEQLLVMGGTEDIRSSALLRFTRKFAFYRCMRAKPHSAK